MGVYSAVVEAGDHDELLQSVFGCIVLEVPPKLLLEERLAFPCGDSTGDIGNCFAVGFKPLELFLGMRAFEEFILG